LAAPDQSANGTPADQPFFPPDDAADLKDTVIPGHREAMKPESRDDLREIR
jgi:hypothetical protein